MLVAALLSYVLWAFIILMFVRVAFSWVSPYPTNSVSRFAYRVTEPILAPVRRWVPPVSGLDMSPMIVMLVAYFLIAALRNVG